MIIQADWELKPTIINGVRVSFARLDDGTWLAAAVDRPRFCFGGNSREEVRQTATRGLDFYEEYRKRTATA